MTLRHSAHWMEKVRKIANHTIAFYCWEGILYINYIESKHRAVTASAGIHLFLSGFSPNWNNHWKIEQIVVNKWLTRRVSYSVSDKCTKAVQADRVVNSCKSKPIHKEMLPTLHTISECLWKFIRTHWCKRSQDSGRILNHEKKKGKEWE